MGPRAVHFVWSVAPRLHHCPFCIGLHIDCAHILSGMSRSIFVYMYLNFKFYFSYLRKTTDGGGDPFSQRVAPEFLYSSIPGFTILNDQISRVLSKR